MANKKRFAFDGSVTISVSTVVWAKDEAAARRIAAKRGTSTGLVDRGDELEEWITSGELDGDVTVSSCEETEGDDEDG